MRRRGGNGRPVKKRRPGPAKARVRGAAKTRPSATPKGDAVDLARELKEAREQQAATAEVLKIISASSGDMAPVFEAMLTNAMRLCEAKFGHILLYDGECFHATYLHDVPKAY